MNFSQLGLTPAILKALADLDYVTPTPIQEGAIPPALQGRDVLGIAQTGTGKTCAFATPILQRLAQGHFKGPRLIRALILTPTRELALQIQESFEQYGKGMPLVSAVIFGGVGQQPQVDKLKKGVDILVATPGRLLDLHGQGLLDLSNVSIFVLDEADRMLDMGFIHDVRRVLGLLPDEKQTLFFSATMPPEVKELVDQLLHDPARVAVTPVSSPVEAIRQSLYYVDRKNKTKLLALLVEKPEVKNALVFSRTKHGANKIAQDLIKLGITAAAIHGNKSQTARVQALSDFKAGRIKVLAATDIAARGLDIEDLSHVFNYNLPDVPETYVHRIGRTGRAGKGGTAVTFCEFGEKDDLKGVEKLLGKPIPVVEDHPYPMEVFEAPIRDKNGRIVNAADQEAREAARERKAARREAQKAQTQTQTKAANAPVQKAAPKPAPKKPQPPKAQPKEPPKKAQPVKKPEPPKQAEQPKKRPSLRHEDLDWFTPKSGGAEPVSPASKSARDEAFERWMEEERAIQAGKAKERRRSALDGDAIMDATARLLAPKNAPAPAPRPQTVEKAPKRPATPSNSRTNVPSREAPKNGRSTPSKPHTAPSPKKAPAAPAKSAPAKGRVQGTVKPVPAPKAPAAAPARPSSGLTLEERKAKIRAEAKARRAKGPAAPTLRPTSQKDSTEQDSLMKPYYLGSDD